MHLTITQSTYHTMLLNFQYKPFFPKSQKKKIHKRFTGWMNGCYSLQCRCCDTQNPNAAMKSEPSQSSAFLRMIPLYDPNVSFGCGFSQIQIESMCFVKIRQLHSDSMELKTLFWISWPVDTFLKWLKWEKQLFLAKFTAKIYQKIIKFWLKHI